MNKPVADFSQILQTPKSPNIYKMAIQAPNIVENANRSIHAYPMHKGIIPTLRRPMSIADTDKNSAVKIYRVVGEGTELLSQKHPGSLIDVLGPLGTNSPCRKRTTSIIIGGGIGVAPLLHLAKTIAENNHPAVIILGFTTGSKSLVQNIFSY